MLKIWLTFLLVCFFALTVFSQSPQPTVTSIEEDEEDVVKISTNLIQIDVTVTDKKGNVVTDLKAEDFEIFENGKKQEITNFNFISKRSESVKSNPNSDIQLPTSKPKPNQVRRTIALVVDDLTLSFQSVYYVRRALKKFVDEQMQEGDLVAIIRTGAGIGALQQFTNDKRQLYQAIERVRWNPRGSGKIGAFSPLDSTNQQTVGESVDDENLEELETERNIETELNEFRQNIFATGTLGALSYIIRGMEELPGRKSVMLFSDGLVLSNDSSNILDRLKNLIDTANRSSVVIYTMDARGLVSTAITAEDNTDGRSAEEIAQAISGRSKELFDTQEGIVYLAKETGGFAFLNNNDLSKGIEKVLDDQSYYLIGYEPDDETFNAEKLQFNKLNVKVKREGLKVRYRSGFLGVSDEKIEKVSETLSVQQKIQNALTSPFAVNDINLTMNTLFKGIGKDNLSLYSFLYIETKDLKFVDGTNGNKKVVFDILAVNFGDNGVPVESFGKTYTIEMNDETYKRVVNEGLVYAFTFPVKKEGAYQMRVVLRDHNSEKVGSANEFVVVPKLKKNRLALSGVALENISYQDWNNGQNEKITVKDGKIISKNNPQATTALRKFHRGTVLSYGLEIYNSKFVNGQKPQMEVQTRVFRNGEILFEGKPQTVDVSNISDYSAVKFGSALNLAKTMQLGEYVLQVTVTDKLAKKKSRTVSEFITFEIIE